MKNLKKVSVLVFAMIFSLFLVACGGNTNNNNNVNNNGGNNNGNGGSSPAIKYTVTFMVDANVYDTQSVESGKKVTKPNNPSKTGHEFVCWLNGEVEWNFDTDTVSKNLTLTAKFLDVSNVVNVNSTQDLISLQGQTLESKFIKLNANIDLDEKEWTPINLKNSTFDGNNYSISRFNINEANDKAGFFGVVENSTVKNVVIEETYIESEVVGEFYAGGLVAYAKNSSLINCNFAGTVVVTGDKTMYLGGIAGFTLNCEVKSCIGNTSVSSTIYPVDTYEVSAYSGGLIGKAENTNIEACAGTGNFCEAYSECDTTCYAFAGGLVAHFTGTINNCYADCSVSSSTQAYGIGSVFSHAGGLVGFSELETSKISNSYASGIVGSISSYKAFAGGLISYSNSKVENCYASGDTSSTSDGYTSYSGGLIAYVENDSKISGCFAMGDVNAFLNGTGFECGAGRLFAHVYIEDGNMFCEVLDCYGSNSQEVRAIKNSSIMGNICEQGTVKQYFEVWEIIAGKWDNTIWNTYSYQNPTLKIEPSYDL